jgi:hypothetical protein
MAQFKSKHAIINITFSHLCNAMQCNAMQYNAILSGCTMQCNAIQCNAMQCNAMFNNTEIRPSVRNEVSQSFFFIFLFFLVSMYGSQEYVRNTNVTDGQTSFSFFSCRVANVTDGQTSFSYFERFSSVAYSQVSLSSVRRSQPKKRKKKTCWTNTETQIRSEVIHSMAKFCSWIYCS